jgi:hypothetical protein
VDAQFVCEDEELGPMEKVFAIDHVSGVQLTTFECLTMGPIDDVSEDLSIILREAKFVVGAFLEAAFERSSKERDSGAEKILADDPGLLRGTNDDFGHVASGKEPVMT